MSIRVTSSETAHLTTLRTGEAMGFLQGVFESVRAGVRPLNYGASDWWGGCRPVHEVEFAKFEGWSSAPGVLSVVNAVARSV